MKESKINRYDILLFLLILCTAGGMWGGAFKPARVSSIILAVPMILSYGRVKIKCAKEVFLFLIFLIIWGLFSLLWSPNSVLGVSEWGNMILRILFFVELVVFGILSKNTFNTLVNSWTVAFLITAIIAVWELNTGNHLDVTNYSEGDGNINLGGGNVITRPFAAATFYNYNGYVTFICYCLPFLFAQIIKWNRGIKLLMAIVPLILVFYVLVLNASRGGILGLIVYAAVFSYFKLSNSKVTTKIAFVALLAGFIFFFAYLWDYISFYLEYRIETDGMSSSRFKIWACCWQALVETGFIGCGIGGVMDALTKQHAYIPQPHNFFIEVLLEFGIIIFGWMLVLMLKVYRKGRNCNDRVIKYIRISSLFAIPFITMIDSTYLQSIDLWAFWGSLILINVCNSSIIEKNSV